MALVIGAALAVFPAPDEVDARVQRFLAEKRHDLAPVRLQSAS